MVHPRIIKIHKNLPGDTPTDFPKFHGDWMYGFSIHWVQTNKQTKCRIFKKHLIFLSFYLNNNTYINSYMYGFTKVD